MHKNIAKYRSDNVAEGIMYWLQADWGLDCYLTDFVKFEKNGSYYWVSTVTWNDYSFEFTTTHFNLNIIAENICNHLKSQNFENFFYKVDLYNPKRVNLRKEYEHYYGYIDFQVCLKNDYTNEHKFIFKLDNKIYEFIYNDNYEYGDFLKFLDSIRGNEEYSLSSDLKIYKIADFFVEKHFDRSKIQSFKILCNVNMKKYFVAFKLNNKVLKNEINFCEDDSDESQKNEIILNFGKSLISQYPEVLLIMKNTNLLEL